MTANELADALEEWVSPRTVEQAATMLRQQEQTIERYHQMLRDKDAEIQWLKEHIEDRESAIYATGYYKGIEYKRLKDLSEDKESFVLHTFTCDCGNYWNLDKYPPRLIEKAKEKNETLDTRSYLIGRYDKLRELTDEEIMVLYEEYIETQYASESNVLGFGRAILRKASEK